MYAGIAVTASMKTKTRLPPKRSAAMPAGSRQIAPFRTATAVSQASCTSVRPNSSRIGMPRTPNMSQTANMRVKPEGGPDEDRGAALLEGVVHRRQQNSP